MKKVIKRKPKRVKVKSVPQDVLDKMDAEDDAAREELTEAILSAFGGPGKVLFEVLSEHPALQKKVFKVMKQYLHPDRETGDEAAFAKLKSIEDQLK